MDAPTALLTDLVDDAALLDPPVEDMQTAVNGHMTRRESDGGWLLGRFLCPADQIGDLIAHLPADAPAWPVGVVAAQREATRWAQDLGDDLEAASGLRKASEGRVWPEIFDVRLPDDDPGEVETRLRRFVAAAGDAHVISDPFIEVPVTQAWQERLHATLGEIARMRGSVDWVPLGSPGATLRCGGEHLPTAQQVATFLASCVELELPFRVVGQLRRPRPDLDAAGTLVAHGFLNLYATAMLYAEDLVERDRLTEVVADPDGVTLDADGLHWQNRTVGPGAITRLRARLAKGHGSQGLFETIAALRKLGCLPADGQPGSS